MRDWRGNRIEIGSLIVYPQRQSSHMWMVEAKVTEITEKLEWSGRIIPALKVMPINATWTHRIAEKPVTLTVLDRVTVVSSPPSEVHHEGMCAVCHKLHLPEEGLPEDGH